jgi:hypothetical protein
MRLRLRTARQGRVFELCQGGRNRAFLAQTNRLLARSQDVETTCGAGRPTREGFRAWQRVALEVTFHAFFLAQTETLWPMAIATANWTRWFGFRCPFGMVVSPIFVQLKSS